jgi:hypothetical protein
MDAPVGCNLGVFIDKRPLELKCAISLVRLGKWEYVSKHFRTAVYFRELN